MDLSDWLIVLGVAVAVAAAAWLADRRRMRRLDPDAVGWMPWRGVAFWATMVGVLALIVVVRIWGQG